MRKILALISVALAFLVGAPTFAQTLTTTQGSGPVACYYVAATDGRTVCAQAMVSTFPGVGAAVTPVVSTAAEANRVVKASAGSLYGFHVTTGASAGYVLTFNATSAPADGAVTPIGCYAVAANSTVGVDFRPGPPRYYSAGIVISFSTTGCFTKTASATAFISADAQ